MWLELRDPGKRVRTTVVEMPARVEVRSPTGYRAPAWIVFVALLFLGFPEITAAANAQDWSILARHVLFIVGAAFVVKLITWRKAEGPPLVIFDEPLESSPSSLEPGAVVRSKGDIARLRFTFRFPRRDHNKGLLELLLDFKTDPTPLVVKQGTPLGSRSLVHLAERLAKRWEVDLVVRKKLLSMAVMPRGCGAFVFLLIIVGSLASGAWIAVKQVRQMSWPTAEATVVEYHAGDEDSSYNYGITYEYTVDGRTYTSNGWNPSPFHYFTQEGFEQDTRAFADGAKIDCWYNPANPREAYVVNSGLSVGPLVLISVGFLCIFLWWYGNRAETGYRQWLEQAKANHKSG